MKKLRRSFNMDALRERAKQEVEKKSNSSLKDDSRFWNPTVDKSGNGFAIIRWLPTLLSEEDLGYWIKYWDHGFQGPSGEWYIEKSLTSIGQTDPVYELNGRLYNSGIEANKELARKQKRRLHYIGNILVVQDKAKPECEGKVYLFQYGKKLWEKLFQAMEPEFEDETPINPFDYYSGANFKIKIRTVDGYRSYDKSEFDKPSALFGGDETKINSLDENLYSLKEFIDPEKYKSYDELKQRLDRVVGNTTSMTSNNSSSVYGNNNRTEKEEDTDLTNDIPGQTGSYFDDSDSDNDDDALSYFQQMQNHNAT